MRLYKLTTQDGKTRKGESNETQWGENVTHEAVGSSDQDLCSDSWIHAYVSVPIAIFMNPIHAQIFNPICWEGQGIIGKREGDLKVGCRRFTTKKQIKLLEVTANQRVAYAIFCALAVYENASFKKWAQKWLSGADRTANAASANTTIVRVTRANNSKLNIVRLARKALSFERNSP